MSLAPTPQRLARHAVLVLTASHGLLGSVGKLVCASGTYPSVGIGVGRKQLEQGSGDDGGGAGGGMNSGMVNHGGGGGPKGPLWSLRTDTAPGTSRLEAVDTLISRLEAFDDRFFLAGWSSRSTLIRLSSDLFRFLSICLAAFCAVLSACLAATLAFITASLARFIFSASCRALLISAIFRTASPTVFSFSATRWRCSASLAASLAASASTLASSTFFAASFAAFSCAACLTFLSAAVCAASWLTRRHFSRSSLTACSRATLSFSSKAATSPSALSDSRAAAARLDAASFLASRLASASACLILRSRSRFSLSSSFARASSALIFACLVSAASSCSCLTSV